MLPLYRDAAGTAPNVPAGLLKALADIYGGPVRVEDLAAYVCAVMAHPRYTHMFRQDLARPGPRVPLTASRELFEEAIEVGARLLWLHTYGERYQDMRAGRGRQIPAIAGLAWATPVTTIPAESSDATYDAKNRTLRIADESITGVLPEVWGFTVSGFPAVERWIGSRTARGVGVGRASSYAYATPLDLIRPTMWEDEWNDELLDLLRVLTATTQLHSIQQQLLVRIVEGELVPSVALPTPTAPERAVPAS